MSISSCYFVIRDVPTVIDDQGRKVGDTAHDPLNDGPSERAAVQIGRPVNDGPDATGLDNGPDEESQTCEWYEECLDGEEMADLVDWEVEERQTSDPEQNEGEKVSGGHHAGGVLLGEASPRIAERLPD